MSREDTGGAYEFRWTDIESATCLQAKNEAVLLKMRPEALASGLSPSQVYIHLTWDKSGTPVYERLSRRASIRQFRWST